MATNNIKNLKPMNRQQAVTNGRKGGMKSVQVRRHKKNLKDLALVLFNMKVPQEAILDEVKKKLYLEMSNDEAMIYSQMIKAINGDTQAAIFLRDTAGQKPIEKQQVEKSISIEDMLISVTSNSDY